MSSKPIKTIGLIGGMSWESTASYYRLINQGVKNALGGFHSARICMISVDFDEIETLQEKGDWPAMAGILSGAARSVEAGGADFLLICTNTMHKVASEVAAAVSIPLLHIADATAERLSANGIGRVGLIGTRFTMEQAFYKGRLQDRFGIDVVVPDTEGREIIHNVIYDELCLGTISDQSRQQYLEIIADLNRQGAGGVILGCTEIALLVQQEHTSVPLYDTAEIHAEQAVKQALGH